MSCAFETKWVGGDGDWLAHNPEVARANAEGIVVTLVTCRVTPRGGPSERGCGGSHTRSAACQELAKTGANRVDRATQAGHADFADLGLRDAVEH